MAPKWIHRASENDSELVLNATYIIWFTRISFSYAFDFIKTNLLYHYHNNVILKIACVTATPLLTTHYPQYRRKGVAK